MTDYLPITYSVLNELQEHMEKDRTQQTLRETVRTGWPHTKDKLPLEIRPYFSFRDEIIEEDRLLYKGNRCIVRTTRRAKALQ